MSYVVTDRTIERTREIAQADVDNEVLEGVEQAPDDVWSLYDIEDIIYRVTGENYLNNNDEQEILHEYEIAYYDAWDEKE